MAGRGRYDGLPTAAASIADGVGGRRDVAYLLPRPPRDPGSVVPAAWHRVAADDRVDLLADRYLGDPQAWWRICDANSALDPDALVDAAAEGTVIVIGVPEV